ncbi:MAG: isocitrate/isopropylmalate dehydrogenase family protein [Oscillospiraceae bacterium]|nr:isocitrate/isopropylmalate dehydrogenase family protein [Oscillospiraceae bacterium]
MDQIQIAQQQFGELIKSELERIERMKLDTEIKDFSKLDTITVGILPGDGVGPILMKQALRVLEDLMAPEIASGRLVIRQIEGMTIERRADLMQSLPDDVFQACKECDVLVKGPMVTPREGDPWPNLVSANSLLRRGLDLFAAVRPIRMPDKGIDWTFFRENIEGEYILGNRGIQVNDDLAIDFKVATRQGCERIGRAALDFCRKNGKKSLTIITKANIVKLVDGNFIKYITEVAEREYPEVTVGTRFVDAMSAKMMDPGFNEGMEVFVLPNLYGDIVTDVAAEHQGGLGTASSSNIGNRYALFEAIHGTAPRLIARGCGDYADPCSLIRAMGMMMAHIGYADRKQLLEKALDICTITERKLVVTRRKEDASAEEFTTYLLETIDRLRNEQ